MIGNQARMESMKVLGINGSPKGTKSQTLRLVNACLKGAQKAGAEIEFVDLCKLNIKYCIACGECFLKGKCVHEDDYANLLKKMRASDGIVWGSPVYVDAITGQMKTLLDRMTESIHCQHFLGKYGCAVSTSDTSGEKDVVVYLNNTFLKLGGTVVGGAYAATESSPEAILIGENRAHELGKTLGEAIKKKREYPEQEAYHISFRTRFKHTIKAHKEDWAYDYTVWQEAGWLE
jgi:multimeric flavodoxin WrbA